MRLSWTADDSPHLVRQILIRRGHGGICAALPPDKEWHVHRRFPLLIDSAGAVAWEPIRYLLEVALIRGSTRSVRTLETYAECLCDWLTFSERAGLPWRTPTSSSLAAYRDALLGTSVREIVPRRVVYES